MRIPLPTLYYLVQHGKNPAIHIGGRWRIKKSSVDHDILRQDKRGQPKALVVDDNVGLAGSLSSIFEEKRPRSSGGEAHKMKGRNSQ